jgi:hypothetical protein
MLRLSGSLLKRPSLTSAGKSSRRSSCVLIAYGRCLRPALYSSLRSSPSHPMGVSALRVTSAIAHVANNGGFASQLPSRAGFFAMNPATRMRPTELRYWRMGPDPDPRPRNTRYLACDHAQPANQHRQQRARCSFERNKVQQNAGCEKLLPHLCIDGWRPLGKNFFDVSATFGRGAVIDPASSKRIPVRGP